MELIRIGISSCLLGEEVRYDGGHKRDELLLTILGPQVEFVPVCPEVEMGLGTPREPLILIRQGAQLRMVTSRTGIDHTGAMNAWAATRLAELASAELSGYILKSHSPSCGLQEVKTFTGSGQQMRDGRGLFASALLERFPSLPVEEEERLRDPELRASFMDRVLAYHRSSSSTLSPRKEVRILRVTGEVAVECDDVAAVEEPLEIRLHDRSFAVIMRTPGADRALAAGFLLAEGVIASDEELGAVEHCKHPDHPEGHNVVNVFLLGDAAARLPERLAERRSVLANSSCGICGRVTIESLRTRALPLGRSVTVDRAVIQELPDMLRGRQPLFAETGALHAAAVFTADAVCRATAEDVGRHNAVDKVVGEMLLAGRLPLRGHILVVSGRSSYEIVQKAWLAGLEIICAVSAPSSLAIDLANEAGITLIGFARPGGFNVYSHPSRVRV